MQVTYIYSLYGWTFRILNVSDTIPLRTRNVPLLLTDITVYGPLYAVFPYLVDCSFLIRTLSPILYVCGMRVRFSLTLPALINFCFLSLINFQFVS